MSDAIQAEEDALFKRQVQAVLDHPPKLLPEFFDFVAAAPWPKPIIYMSQRDYEFLSGHREQPNAQEQ